MGYRSYETALDARRAALVLEIARVEAQLAPLAPLSERLLWLERERDEIDAHFERRVIAPRRWPVALAAVVSSLVVVMGVVLFGWMPVFYRSCRGPSRESQTRSDALELRSAVLLFLGQESGASCPTVDDLDRSGLLDSGRTTDGWGRPYRIVCEGYDIRVLSAGPDGLFGTDDVE